MSYGLNLADDGRILSATYPEYAVASTLVEALPQGDISDYRFIDGGFFYDPLPEPAQLPTQLDRLEAQLIFTAMMTDTLLEE